MTRWRDLFTSRQLVALTTFSDLIQEARDEVKSHAILSGLIDDDASLDAGGTGASAYADAVAVYLAFAVDKGANYWSSLCAWHTQAAKMISTFGRQAIPMVWDFAEANPLSSSSGNIMLGVEQAAQFIETLTMFALGTGAQVNAATQSISISKIVSTDPPSTITSAMPIRPTSSTSGCAISQDGLSSCWDFSVPNRRIDRLALSARNQGAAERFFLMV